MRPPRSALPLPRYVERKPLKSGGWRYFFQRADLGAQGRLPGAERPLGTEYDRRLQRARPCSAGVRFWRTGGGTDTACGHRSQLAHSTGCSPSTAPTGASPS